MPTFFISADDYLALLSDPNNQLSVIIRNEAEQALTRGDFVIVRQEFTNAPPAVQHVFNRLTDFQAAVRPA